MDELSAAYDEFVEAAAAVVEAHAQAGSAEKTAATDAALEAFKQRWELFRVACDHTEELVDSLHQRIGSDSLVDEATGPASSAPTAPGIKPISGVRLEQMSKAVRWLEAAPLPPGGPQGHGGVDPRFSEDDAQYSHVQAGGRVQVQNTAALSESKELISFAKGEAPINDAWVLTCMGYCMPEWGNLALHCLLACRCYFMESRPCLFFKLKTSPIFNWLLQFGGFKEHVLADDLDLTKAVILWPRHLFQGAPEIFLRYADVIPVLDLPSLMRSPSSSTDVVLGCRAFLSPDHGRGPLLQSNISLREADRVER
ncbi:hypothetical protein EJB05_12542 [Eragrostis curvula]|uniref:Uncharacterized protein n=1 Tax=Eragrostis curvula TaxID=38414 RepID=A0A5J9VU24_9POAL|nr:hypothetical protein EJB05_12542 [Eragrostis curvula]